MGATCSSSDDVGDSTAKRKASKGDSRRATSANNGNECAAPSSQQPNNPLGVSCDTELSSAPNLSSTQNESMAVHPVATPASSFRTSSLPTRRSIDLSQSQGRSSAAASTGSRGSPRFRTVASRASFSETNSMSNSNRMGSSASIEAWLRDISDRPEAIVLVSD